MVMNEFAHCTHGSLTLLWTGTAIAAVIFGLMLYSIASFRQSPDNISASFAHNTTAELAWAMIPILILIITAMPAVTTLITIENRCDLPLVQLGIQNIPTA